MKVIKLTNSSNYPVYINSEMIGHFYPTEKNLTRVGVVTHNNGGVLVKETPEQIIKLLSK